MKASRGTSVLHTFVCSGVHTVVITEEFVLACSKQIHIHPLHTDIRTQTCVYVHTFYDHMPYIFTQTHTLHVLLTQTHTYCTAC